MQEALPGLRRPEHVFPVAPNLTGLTGENPQFAHDPVTGLYVRTDDEAKNFSARLRCSPDGSFTLRWWQQWSQDAWKVRHGTPEASLRFVAKLHEEYDELGVEIHNAVKKGFVDAELRKKVISESGDTLWCLSAVASNIDVSIEESYREYLKSFSNGIRIRVNGVFISPSWREAAMAQVVSGRLLTDHDVDRFLGSGFVPQPSPDMNLEPDDFEPHSPRDILHDWLLYRILPYGLENLSRYYYRVNEDLTPREEPVPYDSDRNAIEARRSVAEMMIRTLHTAKVLTGATMGEIVRANHAKITGRIATNLVDHEDGERPEHLR